MNSTIRGFILVFSAGWLLAAPPLCAATPVAREAGDLFSSGLHAYAAERYDTAIEAFEKAVASGPQNAEYHHWLGKAYGRRAERSSWFKALLLARKVRAAFEHAVDLDGRNTGALTDLMEYYLEAPGFLGGGQDKARAIAARLAQLNPADGHRAQAMILRQHKEYRGAERELRQAIALEPHDMDTILDLASLLSQRGAYGEADSLFNQASAIAPESPALLFAKGKHLARSGRDREQARALLEQYLHTERAPDDPPNSEVAALLHGL